MAKAQLKYSEALAELEEILEQIESGALDVDELAAKVRKASMLIKACKAKLHIVDEEIKSILKDNQED